MTEIFAARVRESTATPFRISLVPGDSFAVSAPTAQHEIRSRDQTFDDAFHGRVSVFLKRRSLAANRPEVVVPTVPIRRARSTSSRRTPKQRAPAVVAPPPPPGGLRFKGPLAKALGEEGCQTVIEADANEEGRRSFSPPRKLQQVTKILGKLAHRNTKPSRSSRRNGSRFTWVNELPLLSVGRGAQRLRRRIASSRCRAKKRTSLLRPTRSKYTLTSTTSCATACGSASESLRPRPRSPGEGSEAGGVQRERKGEGRFGFLLTRSSTGRRPTGRRPQARPDRNGPHGCNSFAT